MTSHSILRRLFSSAAAAATHDNPTASYLIHSCGLSPEAANSTSYKVKLPSFQNPDVVLALLRKHEFTPTQIADMVRKFPQILNSDTHKTLIPKLNFFFSIGMSRETMSRNPWLFRRSLHNYLVPCHTLSQTLAGPVFSKFDATVCRLTLIAKSPNVLPNAEFVRELGMPRSSIATLMTSSSECVTSDPALFIQLMRDVERLGFDPRKASFMKAMDALQHKSRWRQAEEVYKSWGWSEDHIMSAFRTCPMCMTYSRKKIMETMDVLVRKMGWCSHKIVECPYVFNYSLKKRILPRCSVVKVLTLKGLIVEEELSLTSVFCSSEDYFLDSFVRRYLHLVPQLLNVYQQGKLEFEDV